MLRFSTALSLLCILFIITGCNTCNPRGGSLAFVKTWDVPAGQTYTFDDPTEGLNSVDFIARVFYPATDDTGAEVLEGEHPLVIFGHGRFGPTSGSGFPNNYLHATYLLNQLTSWGYICVTVNFDVVSSLGFGISERGELFLKAVDFMLAENNKPSSRFFHRINTSQIGLIGHSRGGGGATSAVRRNQAQGSPRNIKALATISPTSSDTGPITGGMPQLMIYGTWDGDLSSAPGYELWDAAPRDKDKAYVEVYGANHFFFSDDLFYNHEVNGISRQNHQNMAKGFINAFFDQQIRGLNRFGWPDYLTYIRKVDTVEYYVQYLNGTKTIIDDGGVVGPATANNLGGTNTAVSMPLFDNADLGSGTGQFGSTIGIRMSWDAGADRVDFTIPATNASAFDFISFRASQRHNVTGNTLNTFKTLKVKLTDGGGNTFTQSISNSVYKGLQYPDQEVYPDLGNPPNTINGSFKNIPSTFRLKLSTFTGVNLGNIVKVTILFDAPNSSGFVNNTGAITFDDLEFTK
ncbi:MAG: hypothetical protein ABL876_03895 [Chitinophagaceae bacterium]